MRDVAEFLPAWLAGALPDWPSWAVNLMVYTGGLLALVSTVTMLHSSHTSAATSSTTTADDAALRSKFGKFRRKFITVYLVIMLADWMQGTHMYTLYLSYGVNVGALFLTGFLSGAVFAPFLGSLVDKYGRKRSCIVYCVLEIIINTLEHSHDFKILVLGRVLGGISTNLLFSAFESWMTTQHRKLGFPEEWLSITYAQSSIGNGVTAILAGIVAQLLEDQFGHIGPFQGAIALTVLALILILSWEENYGDSDDKSASNSLYAQFIEGWGATVRNSEIWRIGMVQGLSEGAMYTFVFMWVPTLLSLDPPGGLPTGCVFSALMAAITLGGIMFPYLQSAAGYLSPSHPTETAAACTYFVAAASMFTPAVCMYLSKNVFGVVLVSFLVCELCVGLFMPAAGTLRSKYVPDALQGSILNIFRLPLNTFVVAGTYATDIMDPPKVFALVGMWFFCAGILQLTLVGGGGGKKTKKE